MRKLFPIFLILVGFVFTTNGFSQALGDYRSVATGAWNVLATWETFDGSNWVAATAVPPGASSPANITIRNGHTVNLEASGKYCNNLTIDAGGKLYSSGLTYTSSGTTGIKYLRVFGTTVIVNGTFGEVGVQDGISLEAGASFSISGSGTIRPCRLRPASNASNLTVTIDADITWGYTGSSPGGGGAALYTSNSSNDNITYTLNAGRTMTFLPFGNFQTAASTSNDGAANTTFNINGIINMGASGNVGFGVATGKTCNVNIGSTGIFNAGAAVSALSTSAGTININITAGGLMRVSYGSQGTCDLSKATTSIYGTFDFYNAAKAIRSAGTATVNSGGKIMYDDEVFFTAGSVTLDAGSNVEYYGASAITLGTTPNAFSNLTINNPFGVTLGASTTVSNTLSLTSGLLILGSYNLTLGQSSTIAGSPSASNMIVADGSGLLAKQFLDGAEASRSFTFPVGDTTGTAEYSPVTLNFTSGSFSSAYAGVKLVNLQHPTPLLPPTDYISRYWTVSQSGISSFSCDAKFKYVDADVVGLESNLYTLKYDNPSWVPFGLVNAGTNELTAIVSSFSDFWGANQEAGPVELSAFNVSAKSSFVQLSWKTVSETNSFMFDIQRKTDKTDWAKIGEVIAAGNSNSPKDYSFTDRKLTSGKYLYRLKMIDSDGSYQYSNIVDAEISMPKEFSLLQNYPNPFNPSTTIDYSLPADSRVTLELYSLIGEKVADLVNKEQTSGFYSYYFNTSNLNLTSGVYLYKLTAVSKSNDVFSQSMKMLLLK